MVDKKKIIEELDKIYKEYWDDYRLAPLEAREYINGVLFGIGKARKVIEKHLKLKS